MSVSKCLLPHLLLLPLSGPEGSCVCSVCWTGLPVIVAATWQRCIQGLPSHAVAESIGHVLPLPWGNGRCPPPHTHMPLGYSPAQKCRYRFPSHLCIHAYSINLFAFFCTHKVFDCTTHCTTHAYIIIINLLLLNENIYSVCIVVVSVKPSAGGRGKKRRRVPDNDGVESVAGNEEQVRELLTQLIKVLYKR